MNTSFIRRRRPSTRSKARMRPISDCLFLLHCLLFISCTTGFLPTPPLPLHQSRRGVHQCVIAYPRGGSLLLSTLHNDESDEESQNEDEMKESFYIRKALYSGVFCYVVRCSLGEIRRRRTTFTHLLRILTTTQRCRSWRRFRYNYEFILFWQQCQGTLATHVSTRRVESTATKLSLQ